MWLGHHFQGQKVSSLMVKYGQVWPKYRQGHHAALLTAMLARQTVCCRLCIKLKSKNE